MLQSTTPVLLYTDGEPDDIFAICLLIFSNIKFSAIFVSESNPRTTVLKAIYIKHLIKLLGAGDTAVIPCFSSKVTYDFELNFTTIDAEEKLIEEYMSDETKFDNTAIELTKMYLTIFKDPIIICIAPVRLLVQLHQENNNIFKNTILYSYGSFNFRKINNKSNLLNMLKSFKQTYIFESYHALKSSNSLNPKTWPKTCQLFTNQKENNIIKELFYIMEMWNNNIIQKCANYLIDKEIPEELKLILQKKNFKLTQEEIKILNNIKLEDPKLNRSFKIIINIINSPKIQMVSADTCLILAILNKKIFDELFIKSTIDFDKDFNTTFIPDNSSNIFIAHSNNDSLINTFDENAANIFQTIFLSKL